MHFTQNAATLVSEVRSFVMDQRKLCVSDREWKHRLRGYGYAVNITDHGTVLTTLPHGIEVCTLD